MKHSKLVLIALAFAGTVMTSCKKDDVGAPTVTINGDKVITLDLHQSYTEQGATASDDRDGSLTGNVVTSGAPDVNNAGVYTINYSVSDKAGNSGEDSRKVIIRHTAGTTAGGYSVKDSCGSSSTSYIDAATENNPTKLTVTKFANYSGATIYFEISGETNSIITVPQQTVTAGTVPVARVFKGSGSISPNGKKLTINYTETTNNTTTSCTGIYTKL